MPASHRHIRPSFALLERLGRRATGALERHGDVLAHGPAFAALPVAAADFSKLRSEIRWREKDCQRRRRLRRRALDELARNTRAWLATVRRDRIDLERLAYPRTGVPEDVLAYSEELSSYVACDRRESPTPLPYGRRLITEQSTLQRRAERLCHAVGEAEAALSTRRRALQQAALSLHAELVAFRPVLRIALGADHPDYQAICFRRHRRTGTAR